MHTVLVIDDDNDYRSGLREILELELYQTLEAENGLVGWRMIQQHSPDLVICDVDMPIMNGFEVLKTVKSASAFANIPFVIVSGQNEQILTSAFKLGAEVVLQKPIDITVLLSAINPYLNNRPAVFK
jgi:CheY-like chemotaxis protein